METRKESNGMRLAFQGLGYMSVGYSNSDFHFDGKLSDKIEIKL